jgi:hypothetical protein
MKSNIQYTAGDVLNMLQSGKFADWYEVDFSDYVQDELNSKSRDEILKDIKEMLN